MEEVRSGRIPFCKLDVLHLYNLEKILPRFGVTKLNDSDKRSLNLAWHRLDAWPDTPPGLVRLKKQFMIAPVSNGNISLMVALARRNNLPWDAILGSEIAGDFKPKPRVYLSACEAFDLPPSECMMVAAHPADLAAAAANGLHTAYIARPTEHGAGNAPKTPVGKVDYTAASLTELAGQLGL
jgi:2-haloacid dehalogenase